HLGELDATGRQTHVGEQVADDGGGDEHQAAHGGDALFVGVAGEFFLDELADAASFHDPNHPGRPEDGHDEPYRGRHEKRDHRSILPVLSPYPESPRSSARIPRTTSRSSKSTW